MTLFPPKSIWVDYSPFTETHGSVELDPTYGHTEYVRKDKSLSLNLDPRLAVLEAAVITLSAALVAANAALVAADADVEAVNADVEAANADVEAANAAGYDDAWFCRRTNTF